ncbi:hypothetical protein ACNOYE_08990 [Nannocystaceae bacterium ST9]
MLRSIHVHLPWLLTASLVVACGDDNPAEGGDETAGSETAETAGSEDEIGESSSSNGDTTSTTNGDTTTSTTTTDDGNCPIGSEGCECTGGGGCDPGLECVGGLCEMPVDDTSSSTDTTSTSTDTTTGMGTACEMDVSFEVLAIDAALFDGWDPVMSMLGEGMVMAWDQQTQDATIGWDLDIPCDDTWHIWVRGIDQGQADSYFASVDGQPDPPPIFELDCTQGPNQGTYVWKELNYRDPADPACTYMFDPWTQDWLTGIHQFSLVYRESGAVSKLWITNTDQPPP